MPAPSNPVMPPSVSAYTGLVYHYTSSVGFLGVLEGRAIRASAAASLNDVAEIRQGWDLIEELLAGLPASDIRDLLQDFAKEPLKGKHEVFVLSASMAGDDANQWRLYADGGKGYAIELDGAVQLAAVSDVEDDAKPAAKPSFGTLARNVATVSPWHKVIYDETEVVTALEELILAVEAEERTIAAMTMPVGARDDYYDDLKGNAYDALATIAHLIKSPGFRGENEVRVVATFVWGDEHIKYRPSNNGIVGYATLTQAPYGYSSAVLRPSPGSPVTKALPVTAVCLGPLLLEEHSKTVKAFLRAQNLKSVSITRSTIPMR